MRRLFEMRAEVPAADGTGRENLSGSLSSGKSFNGAERRLPPLEQSAGIVLRYGRGSGVHTLAGGALIRAASPFQSTPRKIASRLILFLCFSTIMKMPRRMSSVR